MPAGTPPKQPTVFISYAHESDALRMSVAAWPNGSAIAAAGSSTS